MKALWLSCSAMLNQGFCFQKPTWSNLMVTVSGAPKSSALFCRESCCHRCTIEPSSRLLVVRKQNQRSWAYSNCREGHIKTLKEEDGENISKSTLIWRAIKLPIYSVALVPLTVGSAAAYLQTGADEDKEESVVNIFSSRTGTLIAAYLLLAFGFTGIIWASLKTGNVRSLLLLAFAISCGYIYQCPPFRLSYQGLGEPLCFSAFGPFATTAFYLSQSGMRELPITGTILSVSVLVGFTTSLILFCSHFHQIDGDKAVGKTSPLVRLGTKTGSVVLKMLVNLLYLLLFILGLSKALPFTCVLFGALTLPVGRRAINFVEQNHNDKTKIFMAKYYCVRLHAIFGAALAVGLIMARLFAGKFVPKFIHI